MTKVELLSFQEKIKNIVLKVLNKTFPTILIKHFQAVPLHEFVPELNEWVMNDNYCVYIIVEDKQTGGLINLGEIETVLSDLTGYEISVSR